MKLKSIPNKRSLQILRIFGSLYFEYNALMNFHGITIAKPYVTDFINESCNETYSEIRILANCIGNFDCLKIPFTFNVKTVFL